MAPNGLFNKILKSNLEAITKEDERLFLDAKIGGRLFFKSTKGHNTVVAYGYENREGRFVVRFKSPENPLYDEELAVKLRKKGLGVAEFLGTFPVTGQLAYGREQIKYYDIAKWVGYDFGIQAKAAVDLFEKCGWRTGCGHALFASEVLGNIGRLSGNFFGRMQKAGLLYLDFQNAQNLAGDKEICLFDIHEGFVIEPENKEVCLTIGSKFFETLECYPKNQEHKEIVLSILKAGFTEGLGSSKAEKKWVERVKKEIVGWG